MPDRSLDFRLVFESVPGLYLILTPELNIVAVSDAYLTATKTQRVTILGRHLFQVFPDNPEDPTASGVSNLHQSLKRVIASKLPDTMAIQKYDIERPLEEGGGFEEKHWAPLNTPILDQQGNILYIVHRVEDVTERVKLRQQSLQHSKIESELRDQVSQSDKLRQAQRMEAMGQLAGGIAHDFNNILATMLISSDIQLQNDKLDQATRTCFENIIKNCERGAGLIRQLMAFSRRQVLQTSVLNLNTVINELSEMLKPLISENVTLRTNLSHNLGNIRADHSQIEQILLNLVVNARDAMPKGGVVSIETANVTLDSAMAAGTLKAEPGPYVRLSVSDTGIGMDSATQARIFEPFFTTKEVGKGTGLGLATVYGVVQKCAGTIWVYSEPNRGTSFKIYFPLIESIEDSKKPAPRVRLNSVPGHETILVVEDQKELRELVCATLTNKGYKIFSAINGAEGLKVLNDQNAEIDLVISDVIMPVMGGPQMMETAIRLFQKDIKVLYMSGYAEDVLAIHGVQSGINYLEKPFSLSALTEKVRGILNNL